jgi:hypothetical protein
LAALMAKVQLSARVKKLSKDFAVVDGKLQMPFDKMHTWMVELGKAADDERSKLAEELIALAIRFEREGKDAASMATAQLYTFAAGVLRYVGDASGKSAPAAKKPAAAAKPAAAKPPAAKPAAAKSGGWGAKPKR